jgi:hypothetical protein
MCPQGGTARGGSRPGEVQLGPGGFGHRTPADRVPGGSDRRERGDAPTPPLSGRAAVTTLGSLPTSPTPAPRCPARRYHWKAWDKSGGCVNWPGRHLQTRRCETRSAQAYLQSLFRHSCDESSAGWLRQAANGLSHLSTVHDMHETAARRTKTCYGWQQRSGRPICRPSPGMDFSEQKKQQVVH